MAWKCTFNGYYNSDARHFHKRWLIFPSWTCLNFIENCFNSGCNDSIISSLIKFTTHHFIIHPFVKAFRFFFFLYLSLSFSLLLQNTTKRNCLEKFFRIVMIVFFSSLLMILLVPFKFAFRPTERFALYEWLPSIAIAQRLLFSKTLR